ncbi:hypothetical protein C1S78_003270 [Mycolicibacterium mucogenicum DSM 44124]|uniref:Uncharacterized protein n=1 Tax=Mycolicibacterium mucogenicum DSM 44124 TaxID=1226753 RepID=A0A8H2JHV0_MYCMU|nr:hypothetical protein C1S78_003270 [Mycolicibacterium mucogenicum DSM 44124]
MEETVKSSRTWVRLVAASAAVFGAGALYLPTAAADDDAAPIGPIDAGAGVQSTGVTSSNADPAAVQACSQFANALDSAASGYEGFADSLDANDPYVHQSNVAGRTSLRQSAAVAMDAANTPGLNPAIADPMRSWSFGATKLLVKMGIGMTGGSLDDTATQVNTNAEAVQRECAAAGTHA